MTAYRHPKMAVLPESELNALPSGIQKVLKTLCSERFLGETTIHKIDPESASSIHDFRIYYDWENGPFVTVYCKLNKNVINAMRIDAVRIDYTSYHQLYTPRFLQWVTETVFMRNRNPTIRELEKITQKILQIKMSEIIET